MEYCVDGWNNFCRVFEIPKRYPAGFCFSGIDVNFIMVDWFNPVPEIDRPAVSKEIWEEKVGPIEYKYITDYELQKKLIPFLIGKMYIKQDRKYLVICDFGASFVFWLGMNFKEIKNV